MTLTLAVAQRNALANQLADSCDAGPGVGVIRVYGGARPANPDTAPGTTLLAEFALNDAAFGDAAVGVATLDNTPVPTATGLAAGTATWCRVLDSTGAPCWDGKASLSGQGGDFILSTVTISVGLALQLLSGTLTQPLGTAD